MKITLPEILTIVALAILVVIPSGSPHDHDVDPPDPDPIVDTGDILDVAEDEIRDALVQLLGVYADEDLTDSKFFNQFSEELSKEQAKAMMPVSQVLYKSKDLRETAKQLADHTLGR